MRGQRVVIPRILRKKVLEELHTAHFGIVKMKALARSYCWWPRIDSDIERLTKSCFDCNKNKNNPQKVTTHIWEKSDTPFDRVHADYAGPLNGGYYFLLVDSYTKWPEIYYTRNMTTETTIEICRKIFSHFGFPKVFVSDNGTQFTSYKFRAFLKENGVTLKLTAPYHPATNGQAERYVQILKSKLGAMKCEPWTRNEELCKLLLQYCKIPHSSTGFSPAKLMFGREIRSRLDLIKPEKEKGSIRKSKYDIRELQIGIRVAARDYFYEKWKFGTVIKRIGLLHYMIELDDGRHWKRHIDQLREIGIDTPKERYLPELPNLPVPEGQRLTLSSDSDKIEKPNLPETMPFPGIIENQNHADTSDHDRLGNHDSIPENVPHTANASESVLRRSTRIRKAPIRLDL